MARAPTQADLLRAQRARLQQLRDKKFEETGIRRRKTWWAAEYGIDYQTFKKVASGERKLQQDDALTIAEYHGVSAQWVLYGTNPPAEKTPVAPAEFNTAGAENEDTVPVVGWVSAGSQVERRPTNETVVDYVLAPRGSNEDTRALEIQGASLGDIFDRWLVFFDDVHRPVNPDLLNRLCVVELVDGRTLVKKIIRRAGQYDLLSNTEDPIKNVQIRWAARVKSMEPR